MILTNKNNKKFADEITIDERKHTVRSSLYLGFLVNDIVCSLLLDPGTKLL